MFLLKRFDQMVWTLSLESVFGGSFKLGVQWVWRKRSLFIFSLWRRSFSSLLSPNDSRPVVLSNSEMGVVFIPPVIILSPAFWVLVSCSRLVFAADDQALEAYSMWGLTVAV